jgi:FMN phosphatase YigB (HAD superfamily)
VYVGDSYHADVVGARHAGMRGVLFDPGGCWGARDCASAAGLRAAVELALG